MRPWRLAIIGMLAFGAAGCFLLPPSARFWPSRTKADAAAAGPDVVFIDISPLDVPVGDRYVNEELWTAADEQILAPDQRKMLDENGLRVGLISGRTPDELLRLLTSKRNNPAGIHSQRQAGNPANVPLGSQRMVCQFPLHLDGSTQAMKFEQADCRLQLVPTLEADGKVRLQITPQLEYRDTAKWSRLNPSVALAVQGERSVETITALRWDVLLGQNDYAVIGTRFDRRGTLGFQFFVNSDPERPSQHLVAVRAGKLAGGVKPDPAVGSPASRTLASQAASE